MTEPVIRHDDFDLLNILRSEIGECIRTSGNNYKFHCPVCNHRKKKLEIDIVSHKWHCWICSAGGRTLKSLAAFIGASEVMYKKCVAIKPIIDSVKVDNPLIFTDALPHEYISLWVEDTENWFWRAAINYLLIDRKLRYSDIAKYRIGYCLSGTYKNRIIIPNLDKDGNVNFFTARSFLPTSGLKILIPSHSRDIVGFEYYIDWNEPVILVESAINAITLRRNASPLNGKSMSNATKRKIIDNKTPEIIIALDGDAILESIAMIDYFVGSGVAVRYAQFPHNLDINDIGHDDSWKIINNSTYVDGDNLFKLKSVVGIGCGEVKQNRRKRLKVEI